MCTGASKQGVCGDFAHKGPNVCFEVEACIVVVMNVVSSIWRHTSAVMVTDAVQGLTLLPVKTTTKPVQDVSTLRTHACLCAGIAFSAAPPTKLAATELADTINRFMAPDFVVSTRESRLIAVQVGGPGGQGARPHHSGTGPMSGLRTQVLGLRGKN